MPQTYLVFDFGANEEAAQQARHRVEGWRQGFRLGKKLEYKFERQTSWDEKEPEDGGKAKSKKADADGASRIRILIRLDFSNHEKHLFQQWLARIPAEDHFKSAKPEIVGPKESSFEQTSQLYESLD